MSICTENNYTTNLSKHMVYLLQSPVKVSRFALKHPVLILPIRHIKAFYIGNWPHVFLNTLSHKPYLILWRPPTRRTTRMPPKRFMPGRTRTTITQTTIRPPTNDLSKTVEPGHTLHWKGVLTHWGHTDNEGGTEFAHQKKIISEYYLLKRSLSHRLLN